MSETVIYAFGDSIVNGHVYPRQGSVERVAASIGGCRVVKMARNGATICSTPLSNADLGGQIMKQADEVPAGAPAPDVIVFNGLTNDVHQGFLREHPGELTASDEFEPSRFDPDTYAGCFESTIAEFRRRWPNATIMYLAVHKNGAQSFENQVTARRLALGACAKWGIAVADVWADSNLDTRRDEDRVRYSFDALGGDGLPGTLETISYDHPDRQPSGTHPNFPAIDRFYTPVLGKVLTSMLPTGR